jgi:hypothetical protein
MGAITTLAKRANTFAKDTRKHHEEALDGGTIAILPGDPVITSQLSEMLGVPAGDRPSADLLVIPLGMADDARAAALEAAARARQDRRTLVVVICPPSRRGAREAQLLAEPDVTIGDLAFAPDAASSESQRAISDAIVRALGAHKVAAARRYPALRDAVRRDIVAAAARESAVAGALNWFSGASAAQLRMVVRSGSADGHQLDARRLPEIAAAVGSGLVIAGVARGASLIVPAPRWMVRGAVAWASTVALAAATDRIAQQMGEGSLPADPRGAVRSLLHRVRERRKEKN